MASPSWAYTVISFAGARISELACDRTGLVDLVRISFFFGSVCVALLDVDVLQIGFASALIWLMPQGADLESFSN